MRSPSLSHVSKICLPLMLSMLSYSVMTFFDRVIIARYSTEALTGVTAAFFVTSIWVCFTSGVAAICEVFVGRHHGAGEDRLAGAATWQMIWFSLLIMPLALPIAFYAGPYAMPAIHHDSGLPYFRIIMFFAFIGPLFAALSSHFVALGRVRIVMVAALIGNGTNILLDLYVIPRYGSSGAAYATCIAGIIECLFLGLAFLSHHQRLTFGTGRWHFRPSIFWQSLKIGLPIAASHLVEVSAWAFGYLLVSQATEAHMLIWIVGHSLFGLIAFATEGMQKGVTAIASNLLGAGREGEIPRLFRSAAQLVLILTLLTAIPTLLFPQQIGGAILHKSASGMEGPIFFTFVLTIAYFLVDGLVWVIAGILTAGGDTRFIVATNGALVWLIALFPLAYFLPQGVIAPHGIWPFFLVYAIVNLICFALRLRGGRWNRLDPVAS